MKYEKPTIRRVCPVVYNGNYGGFEGSFTSEIVHTYNKAWRELGLKRDDIESEDDYERIDQLSRDRQDPVLVLAVLDAKATGNYKRDLCVEFLEPGTVFRIDEYDGAEHVVPQHAYKWHVAGER